MPAVDKWRAYWRGVTTPGLRHDDDDYYRRYAEELRLLFSEITPHSVLEIGCGHGGLYPFLGFAQAERYRGVDFSDSMLCCFRERFPGVDLVCADGAAYKDEETYDLIFSNQVVQYFDRRMLAAHFAYARRMMGPHSLFICASVLWKTLRYGFRSGELGARYEGSLLRGICNCLRTTLLGDQLGYWYRPRDVRRLAASCGMTAEFYGSMHYAYRFHAVMRLVQVS